MLLSSRTFYCIAFRCVHGDLGSVVMVGNDRGITELLFCSYGLGSRKEMNRSSICAVLISVLMCDYLMFSFVDGLFKFSIVLINGRILFAILNSRFAEEEIGGFHWWLLMLRRVVVNLDSLRAHGVAASGHSAS